MQPAKPSAHTWTRGLSKLNSMSAPPSYADNLDFVQGAQNPCVHPYCQSGAPTSVDVILRNLPRKEVIQPQLPLRLPCYDFTPITGHTLGPFEGTSGTTGFRGVTGGVYKARERIHRGVLIHDY